MSDDQLRVNSREYWEQRFSGDWDSAGGPQQSRFFAELALRMMPRWLAAELAHCKSLADVGCAEGEGAAVLQQAFPSLTVTGIDFSAQAITTARSRHPGVNFEVGDVAAVPQKFDVIFCSNVLEHFHDPSSMLRALAGACHRYLIVLVPGWEVERHHEHHVTFALDSLPRAVGAMHCVHVGALNCARIDSKQWPGYQLMVAYADPGVMANATATLADAVIEAQLPRLSLSDLAELSLVDPALERIGQLAAVSLKAGEAGSALATRFDNLELRQEQIGYNTRHEISQLVTQLVGDVRERIDGAASVALESAKAEIREWRGEAEQAASLRSALDASTRELDSLRPVAGEVASLRSALEASTLEVESLRAEAEEVVSLRSALEAATGELESLRAKADETESLRVALEAIRKDADSWRDRAEQGLTLRDAVDGMRRSFAETEERLAECEASLQRTKGELESWKQYASLLDSDRNRLATEIERVVRLLRETKDSTSWRTTAVLRWAGTTLLGRGAEAPLPSGSDLLPRRFLSPESAEADLEPGLTGDLSWGEFEARVLRHRGTYRGIFIQEAVIDWNVPLYQRPQHVATAFARIGYLVIYLTHNWGGDDVDGFRQISENIWLTNAPEVNTIRGAIRSVYSTAYANTPEIVSDRPSDSVMVYEYIDHIDPQISGDGDQVKKLLDLKRWAFDGGADLVVASARVLHAEAEASVGADRLVSVPNGVDTRHYRSTAQDAVVLPEELVEFCARGPVVGYFGAIAPWLWYDELHKLVAARPDLQFVFIGPDYFNGVGRLPQGPNFLYLGPIDYKVLPAHARLFDVCLIPFAPGEIARTTSPLKLFEYFALEKPVVVTSEMVECIAYPEVFRGSDAGELSEAVDAAMRMRKSGEFRKRLRQLADENDWDKRAEVLAHAAEAVRKRKGGRSRA